MLLLVSPTLFALIGLIFPGFSFRQLFWPVAKSSQMLCQSAFSHQPNFPEFQELGAAFVCGVTPTSLALKSLFLDLNLYHLLVVSGGHLSLLALFFNGAAALMGFSADMRGLQFVLFIILAAFAVMSGLEAPIVRALFHHGLLIFPLVMKRKISRLGFSDTLMISYLLCLCFEPTWIHSLSLHLSCVALIGLSLVSRALKQAVLVFLLLMPLLISLGLPSLPGLFMGALIAPVFEMIFLPSLVIAALVPWIEAWISWGLFPIFQLLRFFADELPTRPEPLPTFRMALYFPYIVFLFFILKFQARKNS